MPRTPDGTVARDKRLSVRVTEDDLALVDSLRGDEERSEYVRGLIHATATQRTASLRGRTAR